MTSTEFTGHVAAMRADAEFFGAEDLAGRGDIAFRITKCLRSLDRNACGVKQKEMFTLLLETANGTACKKEFWIKPTNRKQIIKLYGPNVKDWIGKWVWFYVCEVKSPAGGTTLGIRIRDKKDAPVASEKAADLRAVASDGEMGDRK